MSKTTNRISRIPVSNGIKKANTPLSVLDDGDMELFQQLIGAVIRTDTLLGKAASLLNAVICEDCVIIEDFPAVMSELYLNDLRISALLSCLANIVRIPETTETFEFAQAIQAEAKEVLAVMEDAFEDVCVPAEDDGDAAEHSSGAENTFVQEHSCTVNIAFPEAIDKPAACKIAAQTTALANQLLHDYLDSAGKNSAPDSNGEPDEDSGKEVDLDLGQMSSKDLLGLQHLITQELNGRVELC